MSKKANFIRIFSNTLPIRWELSWKEGFSLRSKKLRKINDCMGGNCLAAALMLFQEAHPSSKLGDVSLKTSCIIFLMMSPPKQSQKIIQSYRLPWRNSRLPQDQRDEIRGRSEERFYWPSFILPFIIFDDSFFNLLLSQPLHYHYK